LAITTNPIKNVHITLRPGQILVVTVAEKEEPVLSGELDGFYTDLYYSGLSARKAAVLYGGSHMRYNRAWDRLGLNTSIPPSARGRFKPD